MIRHICGDKAVKNNRTIEKQVAYRLGNKRETHKICVKENTMNSLSLFDK